MLSGVEPFVQLCTGHYGEDSCEIILKKKFADDRQTDARWMDARRMHEDSRQRPITIAHIEPFGSGELKKHHNLVI